VLFFLLTVFLKVVEVDFSVSCCYRLLKTGICSLGIGHVCSKNDVGNHVGVNLWSQ